MRRCYQWFRGWEFTCVNCFILSTASDLCEDVALAIMSLGVCFGTQEFFRFVCYAPNQPSGNGISGQVTLLSFAAAGPGRSKMSRALLDSGGKD